MPRRTFETDTPLQALLVEQALLLARQLEQTAADAPDGHVLARVEALAVPAGREWTRQAVQAALPNLKSLPANGEHTDLEVEHLRRTLATREAQYQSLYEALESYRRRERTGGVRRTCSSAPSCS